MRILIQVLGAVGKLEVVDVFHQLPLLVFDFWQLLVTQLSPGAGAVVHFIPGCSVGHAVGPVANEQLQLLGVTSVVEAFPALFHRRICDLIVAAGALCTHH